MGKVLALRARDPWREATDAARETALRRETVVLYLDSLMQTGLSQNKAIGLMLMRAEETRLPTHVSTAIAATARKSRGAPTRATLCEWSASYREGGLNALLPEYKGRVVESASWWGPALEYYNAPSKPDMSAVHRQLLEVDGFAVSYEQVRAYLTSVPAMMGRNSPARLGKNLYRLTEKAFVRRSTEHALPGDVYVADGYRADVYLAHPVTGDIWRPELTVALDLRSRVVVGWRADEHEGTYAVQNMWAECFARWGHVPPMLYVDNGSGYKNKLMDDEVTGFYARAGVQQIIHSIPGNPHGKGWVERFFRIVKDDFLKLWRPEFYCGDDIAAEVNNRTVRECKAGRVDPPSLREFAEAFNAWLDRYAQRPHPEDKTVTRAQLWAGLAPTAANFEAAYAAMMDFKGDGLRKLGIKPNLLVTGASNMAAAEAVLLKANLAGGESNTNYKKVELLITPWM
jgi:putative transposase